MIKGGYLNLESEKLIKGIFISAFVFLTASAFAQSSYTSRLGRFKVNEIRGCAPFTVTITTANVVTTGECTAGKPCLMDYQGNGSQQQNLFTFTYTTAGTYKLSVLYQSIGADDITIIVDPNIPPPFEIYSCSGSQVKINITDKNYAQYFIDYENDGIDDFVVNNGVNQTTQHNYGAPGNFNIKVRGQNLNAANNCTPKVQPFSAIATLPTPKINLLTAVDAANLKLDFTNQTNIQYKTEIGVNTGTNFQQFQTLYGVSTLNIPNLKVDDNFYCFRLNSHDPCTNTNTPSIPVCSHNLDVAAQSGVNKLTWQTYTSGITSVDVQRGGSPFTTIPGAPTSFDDVDVTCKTNYCYKVINNYSNGGKSISLQKCVDAFVVGTPTAINNVSTVVDATNVTLTWLQDPAFPATGYSILRSQNNGPFQLAEVVATKQYKDMAYTTDPLTCYQIEYKDKCDNVSQPGSTVCPLRLNAVVDNKNEITLTWPKYKGWLNGVTNYTILKFNKDGTLLKTINAGTDTTYKDDQLDLANQIYFYTVKASPVTAGLVASVSNQVKVVKEANLFTPNAFTPNKDDLNDGFVVFGQYISKMELNIFDRWGSLVFTTEKNEPWNGTRSGVDMPEATYVWTARITDLAGQSFSKSGTVILLRKGK